MSKEVEKRTPDIRFKGFDNDWEKRKLGEDDDVKDGTHDSPTYIESGYPLITSKNLRNNNIDFSEISFISAEDYLKINRRSKVDKGDILFGMIGTIGNPVLVHHSDFAIKNVALIKEKKNILNVFLIQLLNSSIFNRYVQSQYDGGTQKFLSLSKIRNFNLFVPTIQEQLNISNMLMRLDDLITVQRQ